MNQTLLQIAQRNIRQYVAKASFSSQVDRIAANNCLDVMDEALTALAELEKASAEPVAWMWNDEIGVPHASAGSKKPVWLESSASAEYIKQANLRPLYAAPPAPVAKMREPTPEECKRIAREYYGDIPINAPEIAGSVMFDAVRAIMWPKSEEK